MKLIIWDFSRTLLFPKDKLYQGSLNTLYKESTHDFDHLFELNNELISFIKDLNIDSVIFTTGNVQNDPAIIGELNSVFKAIENVDTIGYVKEDPEAYKQLCRKLNIEAKDTLFIDDSVKNLNAAKESGLNVIQFVNNKDLIERLKNL